MLVKHFREIPAKKSLALQFRGRPVRIKQPSGGL